MQVKRAEGRRGSSLHAALHLHCSPPGTETCRCPAQLPAHLQVRLMMAHTAASRTRSSGSLRGQPKHSGGHMMRCPCQPNRMPAQPRRACQANTAQPGSTCIAACPIPCMVAPLRGWQPHKPSVQAAVRAPAPYSLQHMLR